MGAYYASNNLETAIDETINSRERFMRNHGITTAQELDNLVILADIVGQFHDIRKMRKKLLEVYDLSVYSASQALAARLKTDGSNGIVYQSVRRPNGECIAVFRPPVISNAREKSHITYIWDGKKISGHYEKRIFKK